MPEGSTPTGTDTGRLSPEEAGNAFASLLSSEEDTGGDEGEHADRHERRNSDDGEERLRRALRREDLEDRHDEPEEEESEESEEDAEEEANEEESQSDDEQPRKRSPQDPEFIIHVDGKDVPVRLSEMRNGYLRQSDYTRKTQSLANERKSFEQEMQSTRAERAEYAELLPRLRKAVEGEQEPNWAELQTKNPQQFPIEWARWQQRTQQLNQLKAEEHRVALRNQQEQAARAAQYGRDQRAKLTQTEPAFRDPKSASQRSQAIMDSMRAVGFGEDELVVTDHRMIRLLNKAAQLDELLKQQPTIRKQMRAAPVVKPDGGSRQARNPTREASQRLSQGGKVADAAKLFESFLK